MNNDSAVRKHALLLDLCKDFSDSSNQNLYSFALSFVVPLFLQMKFEIPSVFSVLSKPSQFRGRYVSSISASALLGRTETRMISFDCSIELERYVNMHLLV
jgi:hypothetical protein